MFYLFSILASRSNGGLSRVWDAVYSDLNSFNDAIVRYNVETFTIVNPNTDGHSIGINMSLELITVVSG